MKCKFNLNQFLSILLCLCMLVVFLSACGDDPKPSDPSGSTGTTGAPSEESYTVEVLSVGGLPLSGINVYVYADSTLSDVVWGAKTDADGKVSFTAASSDSYVVVLKDTPAGYTVKESYALTGEKTSIKLESAVIADSSLSGVTYKLGDVIRDFTVTAVDGTQYTLSQLLQQKDAVVLNFWYTGCGPCQQEFPHIQAAYDKFSDRIALLALNPVEADDAVIAAFQASMELTIPMAQCDPAWQNALNLVYPTTVVIDRYGVITMIHKGTVPNTQTFENLFAYFTGEDYTQALFNSMDAFFAEPPVTEPSQPETEPSQPETEPTQPETEPSQPETEPSQPETEPSQPETEPTQPETEPSQPETEPSQPETEPSQPETEPTEPSLPEPEPVVGQPLNADSPNVLGGTLEFDAEVPAGFHVYYEIYRVSGTTLRIESKYAYVIYNGKTYWPVDGVISLPVESGSMHIPVALQVGNFGYEDAVIHVSFAYPIGSMMNPYVLSSGDMTLPIEEGNEQGVFLDYTATADQKLTITITSITQYEEAGIIITVTDSTGIPKQYSVQGPVGATITIDLHAGDFVSVNVYGVDDTFSFKSCTVGISTVIE